MKTKKLVNSALFSALVCIATLIIKIPSPFKGYFNLGDCVVLFAGWVLSPFYAFFAAGLGSAVADIISGYVIYAPATFLIKGLMALVAFGGHKYFETKERKMLYALIPCVIAEFLMVSGYFVFEGFLYGFIPSSVNIPVNALQGLVGAFAGLIIIKALSKYYK